MAVLVASVILLYVLLLALTVLVIALYRQFGLVYVGSRRSYAMAGPQVGARAPRGLEVFSPADPEVRLDLDWEAVPPGGATLLLLGGETCPLCAPLLEYLDDGPVPATGALRVLFVDRDPGILPPAPLPAPRTGRWQHWRSGDGSVHRAFDFQVSPLVIAVDATGLIRAKGIVSSPPAILPLLREAGLGGRTESEAAGGNGDRAAEKNVLSG